MNAARRASGIALGEDEEWSEREDLNLRPPVPQTESKVPQDAAEPCASAQIGLTLENCGHIPPVIGGTTQRQNARGAVR